MKNQSQIKCPSCGTDIDVQDILSHQLEDEIKQKYQSQVAEEKKENKAEKEKLTQEKLDFENTKKQDNKFFQDRVDKQLKEDTKAIEIKLKAKLAVEKEEQIAVMQIELNEKSEQVKELNRSKAEIEKLKREKGELKEAAEA